MSVELSIEIPASIHDRILAILDADTTLNQDKMFEKAIVQLLETIENGRP